jgi:hypothetical protein
MATIPAASPKPETGLRYLNSSEPFNMSPFPKRLFTVVLLIILLASSVYWLLIDSDTPSDQDWDANRQNLPDISILQQRINRSLSDEEEAATEGMGADIDAIVDSLSMETKLAGLTKNVTTTRKPTETELAAFYDQHKSKYRESSRFSFAQIVFSKSKHGGQATTMANRALQNYLQQGAIPQGDQSALAEHYFSATSTRVDNEFGNNFAQKLFNLVKDGNLPCWAGPITSNHGVHLVCIENAILGIIPELNDVRSQVINDWRYSVSGME